MNHTANLHLPQWEKTDRIMMEDFNEAMAAIDTAVAGGSKIIQGSYIGNGMAGEANPNTLHFDFAPKMIVLRKKEALTSPTILVAGDTTTFSYISNLQGGYLNVTFSGNSIRWYHNGGTWTSGGSGNPGANAVYQLNESGIEYTYIVFA